MTKRPKSHRSTYFDWHYEWNIIHMGEHICSYAPFNWPKPVLVSALNTPITIIQVIAQSINISGILNECQSKDNFVLLQTIKYKWDLLWGCCQI